MRAAVGKARRESLAGTRRPTVADRRRSDRIVSDSIGALALAAAGLGVPALAGLLYQALAL